jgi:RNA polymerase sigma-70 factor, ECF subfamily
MTSAVATMTGTMRSQSRRGVKAARVDPEVQLMLAVQRGEAAAFDRLASLYWARVFNRFYHRLGDRQESEDLTQDVFLRLYRYRDRYRPRARFSTWLYHITQNVLRNALRSRRRHARLRLSVFGEWEKDCVPEAVLSVSDPPSRSLERAETALEVRRAVTKLMERQRHALELNQFHDQSYSEIAELMDMSPKAAKSLLYRARTQLRDHLVGRLAEVV